MALDLQPVLDLQAVPPPGKGLDLQPDEPSGPPVKLVSAADRPLVAAMMGANSTTAGGPQHMMMGEPGAGRELLRQAGAALVQPYKAIPRIPAMPDINIPIGPGGASLNLPIAAGVINAGLSVPEFMESPLGIGTLPLGSAAAPVRVAGELGMGAFMAHQVPALARSAGTASVEGTPQQQAEAYTSLGGGVVIPAMMGRGLFKAAEAAARPANRATPAPAPTAAPTATPATVSEFGGDTAPPLDIQLAAPAANTAPVPAPEAPRVESPPPTPASAPAPVPSLAAGEDSPSPESVDTLNHQLDAMREGKRAAVLFTPGEPVPQWALDSDQYSTHETKAGTFLYDAAQVTRDQLSEAVRNNQVGRILGYGIDAKPAPEATVGAVVVRDAKGIEKQAVLTDAEHLNAVLKAAQAFAGTGDSVRLERPEDLVASRQAATAPAATPMSEHQRMVQKNIEAMAALQASKESEEANAITTGNQPTGGQPEHQGVSPGENLPTDQGQIREGQGERAGGGGRHEPAEEIPPGAEEDARAALMAERTGEAGPDIIDWLQGAYPQGVRITSAGDYGSYLKEALEADRKMRSQRLGTFAARDVLSNTSGEYADRVLREAHDEGLYLRLNNEDELLAEIMRAANQRKAQAEAMRQVSPPGRPTTRPAALGPLPAEQPAWQAPKGEAPAVLPPVRQPKQVKVEAVSEPAAKAAGQWKESIPTFQGGKRKVAAIASEFIRRVWPQADRNQITTIHDYFGGSGGWGLFNALANFPKATRLVRHEFEPDRMLKSQLLQSQGKNFQKLFEASRVSKDLPKVLEQMKGEGVSSAQAVADRLAKLVPQYRSDTDRAIAQALIDHGNASFASNTREHLVRLVAENAAQAQKAAEAFRRRGGTIEYATPGDSFSEQPAADPHTLAVVDPPYPETAGYQTSTVGLGIFKHTADLLDRLARAGNHYLYTDVAWWNRPEVQRDFELDNSVRTLDGSLSHRAYVNEGKNQIILGGRNEFSRKGPLEPERLRGGQPLQGGETERPVSTPGGIPDREPAAGGPVAAGAETEAGAVAPLPAPNETDLTPEETARLSAAGQDPIENWFNEAIDESRQRSQENAGKLFFRPDLGLSEPVYRTALQIIREAYVRLRDLKGAIEEGLSWLRSNATGWDEAKTRAEFTNDLRERATGQKILAAPGIPTAVKDSINQYLYERAGRQEAQVTADGLLEHYGLDTAMDIWRGAWPEVPMDVRAKLIGSVARELRRQADLATGPNKDQWVTREGQWWNEVLPRNTELGQYISALDGITSASPEGYVAKVRQEMEAQAAEELERHAGDATLLRTALDAGRAEGLAQLRADPRLNEAARGAVDEYIKAQAGKIGTRLNQGIVMELAEPWRQSSTILTAARDAVRAKADELLNKAPRPPGLTAPQHLRVILDDLAQRAADVFASHIQGGDPGTPIVTKLMQRIGVDRPKAQQLATALSKEWDRQLEAAKDALDGRLARQRARQLAGIAEAEPEATPLDRLLRGALREANLKLGDILNQEAGARVDTGKHLADRVVDASGMTGEKADALRTQLRSRYDEIVTAAQDKKLDSLQAAAGKSGRPTSTLRGPLERAWRQLQQLDRLAPVDGNRFYNILKEVLGLPRLTEDQAAELRAAVQAAQKQPAGFLQQRAMIDVMKLEGKIADAHKPWWTKPISRGMGVFYANMLSGLTTYAKIPFENLNLFAGHTLLNWLTRPGELVHPGDYVKAVAGALKRGYGKGTIQALDTLRTGTMTGVYEQPKPPGPLEMQPFGKAMEPLNFWKWFTRAIGVAHETTFKPAWELKTTLLARELARNEGLKGQALDQRVADLLGDTESRWQAARAQAVDELARTGNPSRIDLARRTQEIIEQQREAQLPGITRTARDYAQRVAYLNPSYGFLGAIGDQVVGAIERLRGQFPFLGAGVKSQIPFVKVATNIVNEKLNWSPVGLARAWQAGRTGKAYGRPMLDPNELAELYAKGITGTVALAGLWALRAHIHGAGPTVPQQQQQLKQTGWIPHSIEWNGKYYSYDNTPLMLPMALIGNAEDWARYGKGSDDESATRLAYALKGVGADIFSQGYLDSVGKFFEAIGNRNIGTGAGQMEKIMARTAGTFLFPNLLNQVDKLWDPTLRDQSQLAGLLQAQVPFVRRLDKPTLNALGEPVSAPPFHTWFSPGTTDPLWEALAQQRAWVSEPSNDILVGDKRLGPDYVRALTPDERYELIGLSGPLIRAALEQHLGDGGLADVSNLPPAAARKLVGSTAAKARAQALREMQLTP